MEWPVREPAAGVAQVCRGTVVMSLLAEPLYATLLVLVVTNTQVILAADSRKNTLHPDSSRVAGTMDKIFRTGDCYNAVSGFSSTEDEAFSLQKVIHRTLLLYPDFNQAVRHLAKAIAMELKAYLTSLQKEGPQLFAQLLRDSHSGGEVVLVKTVAGTPTAVLLTYKVTRGEGIKVVVDSWRIDSSHIKGEEDGFWRAIGNTDFLARGMPSVKEVAAGPAAVAKRLMEEGARVHPQWIGGPVNMLELTPGGERWIEKSPTAPAHF